MRNKDGINVIIYKLSKDPGRASNDKQMKEILSYGCWSEKLEIGGFNEHALVHHIKMAKFLRYINRNYSGKVDNLFFGEFRSKWMHQVRIACKPARATLIDDGITTNRAIKESISKGVYLYKELLDKRGFLSL